MNGMKLVAFFAMWLIVSAGFAGDDEPKFKVISVIDGNTVQVMTNNGEVQKIILYGIDSPDSGQNFAIEARTTLVGLVLDKQVVLVMHGKDRYGNLLGEIKLDGADVEYEMVEAGFAWTTTSDDELESVKQHARAKGIGLWTDENPTPPWMFRRQQSMLRSKSN